MTQLKSFRSERTGIARQAGLIALALALAGCGPRSQEVGEFSNDLLGNEVKVDALADPGVPGVVCHVAHFDRGLWDRLGKGNWFEDPSNTSISCFRAGPIDLSRIRDGKAGQEVFNQRQSLFFKSVAVRRIFDRQNKVLLYVSHSRELVEGSAKMSLSTVPLTDEDLISLTAPTPPPVELPSPPQPAAPE